MLEIQHNLGELCGVHIVCGLSKHMEVENKGFDDIVGILFKLCIIVFFVFTVILLLIFKLCEMSQSKEPIDQLQNTRKLWKKWYNIKWIK